MGDALLTPVHLAVVSCHAPAHDTTYEIRIATPEDAGLVEALDGSFTTATIFHVDTAEDGFTLREIALDPQLTEVFPDDDEQGVEAGDSGAEGWAGR